MSNMQSIYIYVKRSIRIFGLNFCGTAIFTGFILIMVSCSGGGNDLAGGGIGGTGVISVGPITDLGSIFVNGVEFETTISEITLDGVPGDETQLKVGMVVTVTGTLNAGLQTGTADSVVYDDSVEGPITEIDLNNNRIIVLGQAVLLDGNTVFDDFDTENPGISDLAVNDYVEVSGLPALDGSILATRIELEEEEEGVELSGFVSNPGSDYFFINNQKVDFSGAVFENFNGLELMAGDFIEVKGTYESLTGVVFAERIILKNSSYYEEDDELELSGFIKSLAGFEFILLTPNGNQKVEYSSATNFENGSENDLAINREIRVEGYISNNVLMAEEISFVDL